MYLLTVHLFILLILFITFLCCAVLLNTPCLRFLVFSISSSEKRQRYLEPTVASYYHSRSLSPATYRQLAALSLDDYVDEYYDDGPKPPFVVRKVRMKLVWLDVPQCICGPETLSKNPIHSTNCLYS